MSVLIEHQIPFHDVDRMNIVWHGHYYKYLEIARTELYRSIHLDVDEVENMGYSLPVIESNCRYAKSLHYAQLITVKAYFKVFDYYLHIGYEIELPEEGHCIATAYTKQAVCDIETGDLITQVPAELVKMIET